MENYFDYFVAKGAHPDKKDILKLEEELVFDKFEIDQIIDMFDIATKIAITHYQKNIGIRITYNNISYEYLMDGIKNNWLMRKEKVCTKTKHSSYYIFLENMDTHIYDYMVNDDEYGLCGGSFPLIVKGRIVGAITCTGLRPHEDHQVIIDTLKNF